MPLSVWNEDIAVNAEGDVVIGWVLQIVSTGVAQVTWRRAGAVTWSGPATLAEGVYATPSVAVDDQGDALAVFAPGVLQTSFHGAGSDRWGAPITIGPSWPYKPQVAFGGTGGAVVAWDAYSSIETATRSADGAWEQPPAEVPGSTDRWPYGVTLTVDRAGNALAAWVTTDRRRDSTFVAVSYRQFGSAGWGVPVSVSDPAVASATKIGLPLLVFDDSGGATAAWSTSYVTESAYRSPGGAWARAKSIARNAKLAGLVAAPGGRVTVAWTTANGGSAVLAASRPGPEGKWSAPVELSAGRQVRDAKLASNASGDAVAMWIEQLTDRYSGPTALRAALRPAESGRWEPAVDVANTAGNAYELDLGMDRHGGAVAVWDPGELQLVELKGSGPILSQLEIPTSGGAGVATRFSVTPVPWGTPLVARTTWDFGDGSSATGNDVRHAYPKEGSYVVRVSAFDSTGASTATRMIIVGKPTLVNTRRPVIRGLARVGHVLRCERGTWTGTGPIVYSSSWLRNGVRVAQGTRYRVRRLDEGALLACRVKATNGPKTAVAVSSPVRPHS